jgi:hypothetical protein
LKVLILQSLLEDAYSTSSLTELPTGGFLGRNGWRKGMVE